MSSKDVDPPSPPTNPYDPTRPEIVPRELDPRETEFTAIREALRGLRYGVVNVVVQDGVVVQIDRTEKRRLVRKREGHG